VKDKSINSGFAWNYKVGNLIQKNCIVCVLSVLPVINMCNKRTAPVVHYVKVLLDVEILNFLFNSFYPMTLEI